MLLVMDCYRGLRAVLECSVPVHSVCERHARAKRHGYTKLRMLQGVNVQVLYE